MSYIKFFKNDAKYYLSSWSVIIYVLLLILTYLKIIPLDSPINLAIYIVMWIISIIGFTIIYFFGHIIRKRLKTDKSLRYIVLMSKFLILLSLLFIRPYKDVKIDSTILLKTLLIIIIYLVVYICYLKLNNKSFMYLYGI